MWLGLLLLMVLALLLWLYWALPVEADPAVEPRVVLLVQNGERQVEGVVRALIAQRERRRVDSPIQVWDFASSDETGAILTRLQRQFTGLQVTRAATFEESASLVPEEIAVRKAPEPTLGDVLPPAASPLVMVVDLRQPMRPHDLWGLLARIWK